MNKIIFKVAISSNSILPVAHKSISNNKSSGNALKHAHNHLITSQFIGERLPFNESYFWLLHTTAGDRLPLELLDRLPLSVNAELTLAVRGNGSTDRFELYDVYNPSYRHGGELNVTEMGYWKAGQGVHNKLTQYKYKRRGDLRGMYLNFSIVVSEMVIF